MNDLIQSDTSIIKNDLDTSWGFYFPLDIAFAAGLAIELIVITILSIKSLR